ncbi:MAG: hypothetical protein OXC10_08230, partial [Rhodospirillaceae bacterium]|nr:hypothetical protein [Rhodospirillaceae bacterium]
MSRFPELDRPFHLLKKIAETARPRPAALRATPCAASLFETVATRSALPIVTQKLRIQDNNPCAIDRKFPVGFQRMGRKISGFAGFPDLVRPVDRIPLPLELVRFEQNHGGVASLDTPRIKSGATRDEVLWIVAHCSNNLLTLSSREAAYRRACP